MEEAPFVAFRVLDVGPVAHTGLNPEAGGSLKDTRVNSCAPVLTTLGPGRILLLMMIINIVSELGHGHRRFTMQALENDSVLPGSKLDAAKMPGHWLLARMGKKVLRPGGLTLTRRMLDGLAIGPRDRLVELAPGLGATARLALARRPASYVGVDRDGDAVALVRRLAAETATVVEGKKGDAANTGLADGHASVVYGEAMLTMQPANAKRRIVQEAFRVLAPGGRYGIHEMGLRPDDMPEGTKDTIMKDLSEAIRVGARPLTISEWRAVLEAEGFEVVTQEVSPMHLLEPRQMVRDEGVGGTLRILLNIARNPIARRRILGMRRVFQRYESALCGVMLVARKPMIPATLAE